MVEIQEKVNEFTTIVGDLNRISLNHCQVKQTTKKDIGGFKNIINNLDLPDKVMQKIIKNSPF